MNSSQAAIENAYRTLMDAYWQESPGCIREAAAPNLEALHHYLASIDTLDNASVALVFLAQDELLLAGNLLARGDNQAWPSFDKAQAHAYLAYKHLAQTAWIPSKYTSPIFGFPTFCTFFSLALVRGSNASLKWYAQQLYNLKRGGLADWSCDAVEYVDFYFELAVAVMNDEWPDTAYLSDEMGLYKNLFKHSETIEAHIETLQACADRHLSLASTTAPRNAQEEAHPFRSIVGNVAYELWGWLALQRRLDTAAIENAAPQHPMLLPAFFKAPPPQKIWIDEITTIFNANASKLMAQAWKLADTAKNFDTLWPEE